MAIEKLNPPDVAPPIAFYSHLAVVPSGHKLLVLAGQVGNRLDGSIPDSLDDQFEQALNNIVTILRSQGANSEDVVKVTCYLAERPQNFVRIGAALRAAFTGKPPAQTFLIVVGLAYPQLKVEIEAVAAVRSS